MTGEATDHLGGIPTLKLHMLTLGVGGGGNGGEYGACLSSWQILGCGGGDAGGAWLCCHIHTI